MKKILFLIIAVVFSCTNKDLNQEKLFSKIDVKDSGILFNNQLVENDSINIIDKEFVYNGAGVALGDVNGDGFDDIFFAGNQVENKLFLNKGKLKFQDITTASHIQKADTLQWSSGVAIIDINADGMMDIYVCNTFRGQRTPQGEPLIHQSRQYMRKEYRSLRKWPRNTASRIPRILPTPNF